MVRPVVWARATIDSGSAVPSSITETIAAVLVSSRRASLALNYSSPDLPSVFPPQRHPSIRRYWSITKSFGFGCNLFGILRPSARVTTNPTWPIGSP